MIYAEADWCGIKCPGGQMEEEIFNTWLSRSPHAAYGFETWKRQEPPYHWYAEVKDVPPKERDAGTNQLLTERSFWSQRENLRLRRSKPGDGLEPVHASRGNKVGRRTVCWCVNTCTCPSLKLTTQVMARSFKRGQNRSDLSIFKKMEKKECQNASQTTVFYAAPANRGIRASCVFDFFIVLIHKRLSHVLHFMFLSLGGKSPNPTVYACFCAPLSAAG